MVQKAESIFDAFHQIILAFFFKLGVFSLPLANAILIGFATNHYVSSRWGMTAGLWSGIGVAIALETAGIVLSWNFKQEAKSNMFIAGYIVGSWLFVWIGLQDGWFLNILGFIMPIFAVVAQYKVSQREQNIKQEIKIESKDEFQLNLLREKELSELNHKHEMDKLTLEKNTEVKLARSKSVPNGTFQTVPNRSTGSSKSVPSLTETEQMERLKEWMKHRNGTSATEMMERLGLPKTTFYRKVKELKNE